MTRDCLDSTIPNERPHDAEGRSPRCREHREQRERWTDINRKRPPGSQMPWPQYVKPRPAARRGVEISHDEATNIKQALAFLATAKVPLDSHVRNHAPYIPAEQVQNLVDALDQVMSALRPITRPDDS